MNDGGEKDDWINELSETKDQLGRLSEQLKNIDGQNFSGVIGRIEHLQTRLDSISEWLRKKT